MSFEKASYMGWNNIKRNATIIFVHVDWKTFAYSLYSITGISIMVSFCYFKILFLKKIVDWTPSQDNVYLIFCTISPAEMINFIGGQGF